MWIALTEGMFAIAPTTREPLAHLSVGAWQIRQALAATLWARPDSVRDEHLLDGPPFSLRIGRSDIYTVEAVEPCPSLRVSFRSAGVPDDRVFRCATAKAARSWARTIEALFEALEELGYDIRLERGWLAYQDVRWETLDALPERRASPGEGAYRSTERAPRVVARRPACSGIETMLVWLTSGPERSFKSTPNEVVLTSDEIFVRFHGGRIGVLPRDSLNRARQNSDGDVSYRFGRHVNLLLPHREGCEVVAALDAQLEAAAVAGSSA